MIANCKVKVGDGGVSSVGMLTVRFYCPIYYVPFCVQTEACRQNNVWHVEGQFGMKGPSHIKALLLQLRVSI